MVKKILISGLAVAVIAVYQLLPTRVLAQQATARTLLTAGDFTHDCTMMLPDGAGVSELQYGVGGVAFKREPGDGGNKTIFIAAQRGIDLPDTPYDERNTNQLMHQFRLENCVNPASPALSSSYTPITTLKNYDSSPYKDANGVWKRTVTLNGVDIPFGASSGPDYYGLYNDPIDDVMCWMYTATYSDGADVGSKSFGCSKLNYATGTGVGRGPFGVIGHYAKSIGSGMVGIPKWYADAYLGGKRLAVGVGGYGSICGQGVSMGPKLVAIDPPTTVPENTSVPGTELIGFPSCGDFNRYATRPPYVAEWFESNGRTDKWTWSDSVNGACWIDTGTKHGVLFLSSLGQGVMGYLSSSGTTAAWQNYWILTDPMQFAPVAGRPASDVPLTYIKRDYAFDDEVAVPKTPLVLGTITTATSTAGGNRYEFGTNVLTLPNHGLLDWFPEIGVYITGNSNPEFNGGWNSKSIDANTFSVRAGNDIKTWSGKPGTGGTAYRLIWEAGGSQHLGCAWDSVEKKVYVVVRRPGFAATGGPHIFIDRWSVNDGATPTPDPIPTPTPTPIPPPLPPPVPTSWVGMIAEKVGSYSNGDKKVVVRVPKTFTPVRGDTVTVTK